MSYLFALTVAAFAFVAAHGGLAGDASSNPGEYDTDVIFNRWALHRFEAEPFLYRSFVNLNAPAWVVSRQLYRLLEISMPEFDSGFPYGLSWRTYELFLFVACGFAQWYGVGFLIDRWKAKSARTKLVAQD
jgi:hypothetical protein